MNLAQQFNSLNGMIVSRKTLELLLEKAEKEKHTVISKRVLKVLEAFQDDTFLIEINNLVEPFGLNGKQHTGTAKHGLDDCGRLTKGHKYTGGKVVKTVSNVQKKTKKAPKKPVLTLLSIEKPKYEVYTNPNPQRVWRKPKPLKEKVLSIPEPLKTDKNGQYALLGAVKKGLNAPRVEKETIAKNVNKNSLAYKMANKPKNVDFFKIENKDIADFLGKIEQKKKESIVISLTGGQGSMKTRMCFQFMDALAQNYTVGHASIEEHPESSLYYDKANEYLDNQALLNIEAPEIKSVSDLEKLIRNNEVIVIDSFSKMQEMHKGFEVDKDLRKKYDGKLFIVIFQQTTDGKMRGGSKSQFDADIVLFTEKMADYRDNYIYADKNRYQDKPLDGLKFNIFSKKLIQDKTEEVAEPTTKKKLSFIVN